MSTWLDTVQTHTAGTPDWLVVAAGVILALALLWIGLRLFAWLIKWLIIGVAFAAVVCLALYIFAG